MPTIRPRPSDPSVARAFERIDPTALPTSTTETVNGELPDDIANRCQEVSAALCELFEQFGIDACEVYLSVDHHRRHVDLARALDLWRHEAEVTGIWGHVVLGVRGRRGDNPLQLEGPRGAVELWDYTGRQYDAAVPVPHMVDLGNWGPYDPQRRPVCRRTDHRLDRARSARCLLPDPAFQRFARSRQPVPRRQRSAPNPARPDPAGPTTA